MIRLTLWHLSTHFEIVIWFLDNLVIQHAIIKHVKQSCRFSPDRHFLFKDFAKYFFVRELSPKLSVCFGALQAVLDKLDYPSSVIKRIDFLKPFHACLTIKA